MRLLRALFPLSQARRIHELAAELADTHFEAIWGRVHSRVARMNPAEARGYVRAYAAAVLRGQVRLCLIDHPELRPSAAEPLLKQALDDVNWRAMAEIVRARREAAAAKSAPAAAATLRKAA
jgi:hypothetical protein